ncbi:PA2169 family four-helix-bundle protein [Deinococcus detaillensis]|uniref:PA2169 family four-helix-bundle protein n=1 Tax=Deinococcus detaillensis TaxID=2592048 RepID=A0A553V6B7_9DEIO|nr:PA2169 family four-helix-bundle protein [Deinococcus detaillensis]TSA88025.1 PA2169 family four-helix-bundle protein [Deinococcus detaillensis]
MTMTNDQVNDKLQYLLGTLRDGEKGFNEAAEHAHEASLKQLFQTRSAQRSEMISAIETHLMQGGEKPKSGGSVVAALHRTWINVRDAVTGKDDTSVIAETVRGEDAAISNYQDVLKETELPSEVRSLVEGQYAQIQSSDAELKALKQQYEAKS